jgi:enamine deaminase RidA (YjgF/YER057c/UK114 family)
MKLSTMPSARESPARYDVRRAPRSVGPYLQTTSFQAANGTSIVFTSGQLAINGSAGLIATGRVGDEVDLDTGIRCARQCALNVLAQIEEAYGLTRVDQILKLTVFVASSPTFSGQHLVANGASDLLASVLGTAALHSRSAIGVAVLPLRSPVEVDAIVALLNE